MPSWMTAGSRTTGTAQGHGLIGGKAQGRAAVEAEHQAEADEPVAGRADAKIHVFDVLHKPEKNGQRKLWQASFFPRVVCPHFDMEQQAHQSAQRESRRQRDDRLEVLQKEGLGDLCGHENSSAVVRPGAHFVVEVVPVAEKGRPHIVVGALTRLVTDDEQAR